MGSASEELWSNQADLFSDPAALLDSLFRDSQTMLNINLKDAHVATWTTLIPVTWHPIYVKADPEFDSYNGLCGIYSHLGVMNIYNRWRSVRISLLSSIQGHTNPHLQTLIDEICASVPFGLGNRNKGGPIYQPGWKYPHLEGAQTSQEHYRMASTLGGFYLARPLMQIVGLKVELRDGQREWISRQLRRIARLYGMKGFN